MTILDVLDADIKRQLLQVHDILELPTLPNSIKSREEREREKFDKKEENQKITGRFHNFIFRRVYMYMDICEVINDGVVVVADKKGKIALKAKK